MGRLGRQIALHLGDARDFVAYWLVIALPSHWSKIEPIWLWLLPYAGGWAYRTDPYVQEVREHWLHTGLRALAADEGGAS